MELESLNRSQDVSLDEKLEKEYRILEEIIQELRSREIPEDILVRINTEINDINTFPGEGKDLKRKIRAVRTSILKIVEKELKLVPRNYYRNQWMALGMSVFGIPLGVVFGSALGNLAFLGIGLPIGMSIGLAVGTNMDQKAQKEGRQLDVEL
ncbi:hypothetical protein [Flavilitoribacter nigricans]|uniref:hypothetical protein n=1 Tax=Flavilitoribacter nigricans TaxID=70997 RepID=UPI001C9E2604|nr:hypothetical protein [Flavilitoribacter nigricans]